MCIAAFGCRRSSRAPLTAVALVILSDGENGGRRWGAVPFAEEHPGAFGGAKHALGEFPGGATQWIAGKPLYPIQVAEKQQNVLDGSAHVRGPTGGHGALE